MTWVPTGDRAVPVDGQEPNLGRGLPAVHSPPLLTDGVEPRAEGPFVYSVSPPQAPGWSWGRRRRQLPQSLG